MIGISDVAVHEAAHAVVFAYLRVPFDRVTIKPRVWPSGVESSGYVVVGNHRIRTLSLDKQGCLAWRSPDAIHRSMVGKVENRVIGILAPQAALSLPQWCSQWESGDGCEVDEEDVEAWSKEVGVQPEGYPHWRAGLMKRAVEIVSIPFVSAAISQVAFRLEVDLKAFNKGISSSEVRETLRYMRDQQPEQLAA
jgi:hypothetical protein